MSIENTEQSKTGRVHFTLQREELLEPLQLVIGVVERRQTLPILANVLLAIDNTQLLMTATDLEVELIGRVTIEQPVKAPIKITVPGRKLLDICRALPDKAVLEIHQDKERLIVRSGRSRFMLTTLPVTDFPNLEEVKFDLKLALPQKDLNYLFHRTYFAMAQQDVRYYLNGMLLEVRKNSINAVATDGHRLALNTLDANADIAEDQVLQAIIPRKGVVELLRLINNMDSTVNISLNNNHIRVSCSNFTFTSKLIEGRFPDYEKVLPKNGDKIVELDKGILKEALMRASILSNEKFRGVRFQLHAGLLRIVATNPQLEEAEEIIQTSYQGDELDVGFNVTYLVDILNTLNSEKVKLTFIDSNSSVLLEEVGESPEAGVGLFVVMPLRL